jgi:hypothetical protein
VQKIKSLNSAQKNKFLGKNNFQNSAKIQLCMENKLYYFLSFWQKYRTLLGISRQKCQNIGYSIYGQKLFGYVFNGGVRIGVR